MERGDRPVRYVGENDYMTRHRLGSIWIISEFITLAIISLVGIHRTLLVMWKVEAFGIICTVVGSFLHFNIVVCYGRTYWYEFRQMVYKTFENVPFKERKGGSYFVLCIAAAFYMTLGLVIIHIVGIFKAMFNPAEDGVMHLILLAADINLLRHFVVKAFLISQKRDGKYSIFAVTPMLLNYQLFAQRRGQSLEVQDQQRPGLNVVSVQATARSVPTPTTPLM